MQPELSREVPQQGAGAVAAADPERVHSVLVRPPCATRGPVITALAATGRLQQSAGEALEQVVCGRLWPTALLVLIQTVCCTPF